MPTKRRRCEECCHRHCGTYHAKKVYCVECMYSFWICSKNVITSDKQCESPSCYRSDSDSENAVGCCDCLGDWDTSTMSYMCGYCINHNCYN